MASTARICITGFYGWGNAGDEGILLSILDSLGENQFIICTNLPHTMLADYKARFPDAVKDVRQIYDVRSDYDAFILGGGALGWGFGWHQAINAFSNGKPAMNYGVEYVFHRLFDPKMNNFYRSFLANFNAITIRDRLSCTYAYEILGLEATLTACPSINLKEEAFDCPKGMIAVCPRYEDYESNDVQLDWFTERLKDVEDEVLLIPFAPYDSAFTQVDLALCLELKKRLKHSQILNMTPFVWNPRKVKYAISKSKLVISGGRYHALVWASAHNVPFEISPTCWHYPKISGFEKMHAEFGAEKLKEMEKENKRIFVEKCMNDKHT